MKIVVKPKYERSRWFRDLVAAFQFAEEARRRQGPRSKLKYGAVAVHIYDGYSPHILATYGAFGGPENYMWTWSRA